MNGNKYGTNTRALDAESRLSLAENDLDDAYDAARVYAFTIPAQASREAVLDALASAVNGNGFTLPADMPAYEAAYIMDARQIRKLLGILRTIQRCRSLVDA